MNGLEAAQKVDGKGAGLKAMSKGVSLARPKVAQKAANLTRRLGMGIDLIQIAVLFARK